MSHVILSPRWAVLIVALLLFSGQWSSAAILAGPWLQAGTETSMVIMWETDAYQPERVEYGLSPLYGQSMGAYHTRIAPAPNGTGRDTSAILHTALLSDLRPNTQYHYRVTGGQGTSADATFITHKQRGTYRVVHVSDTHTFRLANTRKGLASILAYQPDYVILSGDIANTSTNSDYRAHMRAGGHLWKQTVHYTIKGNHDARPWTTYSAWFHNAVPGAFSEDFYAFTVGPVHYIGINNTRRQKDYPPGSLAWLEQELSEHRTPWKVVFMKANPAITWKDYASQQAEFLMPLFARHGVDVVLTGGNSHGFKRQVDGVWYLHAGLGHNKGYWTLEIAETGIHIAYRQATGRVMQSFVLEKPLAEAGTEDVAGERSGVYGPPFIRE
jgi:predicted phosphodiesterase